MINWMTWNKLDLPLVTDIMETLIWIDTTHYETFGSYLSRLEGSNWSYCNNILPISILVKE
jgi:hypothetical protein